LLYSFINNIDNLYKMKDKILIAIKTKYANLGLSAKTLEGFANILVATITDEEQIETAVNGLESFAKLAQSEADRVRQEARPPKQPETPKPEVQPEMPKPSDNPELNAILQLVQGLKSDLDSFKTGVTGKSRKELLESSLKDVPEGIRMMNLKAFEKMQFANDEEFTAYLGGLQTTVTEFTQSQTVSGLAGQRPTGSNQPTNATKATKEEIDNIVSNII
jgi:hypothetical protein